jgi:adenylate cyclase
MRFVAHALLSAVALSAFGLEVCPYLHGFGAVGVGGVLLTAFAIVCVLRPLLMRRLVDGHSDLEQPVRQLQLDLGLFVAAGLLVLVFDAVVLHFPIASGARIVVGALTMGLFAAIDGALARERKVLLHRTSNSTAIGAGRFFSLSRKFAIVAFALFSLTTIDLFLLGMQDIRSLVDRASRGPLELGASQGELLLESAVALAVLLPLLGNVILSFARNLRLFLDNQRGVLEAVARGELNVVVPVASTDEFAVIAHRTNEMIAGLRERKRVAELIGKLVSPAVATRLLSSSDGLSLVGSRRRVVVLFSDIRNFTTRTEHASPEVLVSDLNRYFTEMVDCVHRHGGIVDKFIGDGMMAIFGLEDFNGAADAAVAAACDMQHRLVALNAVVSEPIEIGVGLHAGEAVAGTIGAPDRLEFTFIGDVVNAAARIEGLTKNLAPLLVSRDVKDALSTTSPWRWTGVGEHALKGKQQHLELFRLHA